MARRCKVCKEGRLMECHQVAAWGVAIIAEAMFLSVNRYIMWFLSLTITLNVDLALVLLTNHVVFFYAELKLQLSYWLIECLVNRMIDHDWVISIIDWLIYTYFCTFLSEETYVYVYVYVCFFVCMYVHIYTWYVYTVVCVFHISVTM